MWQYCSNVELCIIILIIIIITHLFLSLRRTARHIPCDGCPFALLRFLYCFHQIVPDNVFPSHFWFAELINWELVPRSQPETPRSKSTISKYHLRVSSWCIPILGTTSFPTTTDVMNSREANIASSLNNWQLGQIWNIGNWNIHEARYQPPQNRSRDVISDPTLANGRKAFIPQETSWWRVWVTGDVGVLLPEIIWISRLSEIKHY